MKPSSILITGSCIAALALCLPITATAQTKKSASPSPAESASPTASAKAKTSSTGSSETKTARAIPFHGTVSEVDQKAKTFTIAGKTSTRVFKVGDNTTVTKAGDAATMADITANERVTGSYWKQADGTLEAKTVKVGGSGGTTEKATKKPKKKKDADEATGETTEE